MNSKIYSKKWLGHWKNLEKLFKSLKSSINIFKACRFSAKLITNILTPNILNSSPKVKCTHSILTLIDIHTWYSAIFFPLILCTFSIRFGLTNWIMVLAWLLTFTIHCMFQFSFCVCMCVLYNFDNSTWCRLKFFLGTETFFSPVKTTADEWGCKEKVDRDRE